MSWNSVSCLPLHLVHQGFLVPCPRKFHAPRTNLRMGVCFPQMSSKSRIPLRPAGGGRSLKSGEPFAARHPFALVSRFPFFVCATSRTTMTWQDLTYTVDLPVKDGVNKGGEPGVFRLDILCILALCSSRKI